MSYVVMKGLRRLRTRSLVGSIIPLVETRGCSLQEQSVGNCPITGKPGHSQSQRINDGTEDERESPCPVVQIQRNCHSADQPSWRPDKGENRSRTEGLCGHAGKE